MFRFYSENSGKNDYGAFVESISDTFNRDRVKSIGAALTRTGMLLPIPLVGAIGYVPGANFYELCQLAQIEDAAGETR